MYLFFWKHFVSKASLHFLNKPGFSIFFYILDDLFLRILFYFSEK